MKSYEQMLKDNQLYTDSDDMERLGKYSETQRETILYERYIALNELENKKKLETMSKKVDQTKKPLDIEPEKPKATIKFQDCDFILNRNEILPNIFKPNIHVLKGCFARVKIDKEYKIGKIVGFDRIKPYSPCGKPGSQIDLGVILDCGSGLVKTLELNFVSSGRIQEEEFDEFKRVFRLDSVSGLREQYKKALSEMKRSLTNEEITKMIENKQAANPKKQTNTARKIKIILERDKAIENRDKEAAKHYQQLLQEIEDEEREEKRKNREKEIEESKRRLQNK